MSVLIHQVSVLECSIIQHIAQQTWHHVYAPIISKEQIAYMLDLFYNDTILLENISQQRETFYLIQNNDVSVGFISYSLLPQEKIAKIHKLYILPTQHRKGFASILLNHMIDLVQSKDIATLVLNVNKYNANAIKFYENQQFKVAYSEVNPIGKGFVMDDYVLEKTLI